MIIELEEELPEDPGERFMRLSQSRYEQFQEIVRKIGNLSNRNNYDYSDDQVTKLFNRLRDRIDEAERKFKRSDKYKKDKLWDD